MKSLLIYSIPLTLFLSCTNRTEKESPKPYKVTYKQLQVDTTLRHIFYINGYFVCLQENSRLAIFDSNFIRKQSIEDSINLIPIGSAWGNDTYDTIFFFKGDPDLLGWPKEEYYFRTKFKIQKRKFIPKDSMWPVNSWPLLVDSNYNIYSNANGSYGFFVFFYNKASKRTYVTWSHGPWQVLKFDNSYYIAEEGNYQISPAFRVVSDPTKLIQVSDSDALKLKQLYQHLAVPPTPLSYYRHLADSIENNSPQRYGGSGIKKGGSIPIYTFTKTASLYSLIKNDSSIYLVAHRSDSLVKVQTILDTSIEMHRLSYSYFHNTHLITFEASGGKTIENRMQNYSDNGFILIKDSSIYFLYSFFHKTYDP